MTRPLAEDRDPGRFPYRVTLPLRHTDLDAQKLVSNVALAELFEDARTRYSVERRLKPAFDPHRRFLAGLEIAFGEDGRYPGEMEFALGVVAFTECGWTLRAVALQRGAWVAGCDTRFTLAGEDGETPLPNPLRAILSADLVG